MLQKQQFVNGHSSSNVGVQTLKMTRVANSQKVQQPESIKKISSIVFEDRRSRENVIGEIVGISFERVYRILTQELGIICVQVVCRLCYGVTKKQCQRKFPWKVWRVLRIIGLTSFVDL